MAALVGRASKDALFRVNNTLSVQQVGHGSEAFETDSRINKSEGERQSYS